MPGATPVPVDPAKGYYLKSLGNGVYWVTDGLYQMMFLTTGRGVIVVDAPPSLGGARILKAIAEVTKEKVTHLVYSHFHADHIAGAGALGLSATAKVISHQITADRLARTDRPAPFGVFAGGSTVPAPTITFKNRYVLRVGNQELWLEDKGDAHCPGNVFIYAPRQKILMVVDLVFPGWAPFEFLAVSEFIPDYIAGVRTVLTYDFNTLIGGHFGRLGKRQDAETLLEYLTDLQNNAIKGLQSVDFVGVGLEIGFANTNRLISTYLDRVNDICVSLTVPKWVSRLQSADIQAASHCRRVVESIRID